MGLNAVHLHFSNLFFCFFRLQEENEHLRGLLREVERALAVSQSQLQTSESQLETVQSQLVATKADIAKANRYHTHKPIILLPVWLDLCLIVAWLTCFWWATWNPLLAQLFLSENPIYFVFVMVTWNAYALRNPASWALNHTSGMPTIANLSCTTVKKVSAWLRSGWQLQRRAHMHCWRRISCFYPPLQRKRGHASSMQTCIISEIWCTDFE